MKQETERMQTSKLARAATEIASAAYANANAHMSFDEALSEISGEIPPKSAKKLSQIARDKRDLYLELARLSLEESDIYGRLAGEYRSSERRAEAPESAGVYAIRAPNGLIKIGRSKNISLRVQKLQTESPHKYRFLAVLSEDPADELTFHRRFSDLRQTGEWFRPSPNLLSVIESASRGEKT